MAIRKANLDDTVSLFSFLDIMASLIGILVLMIVLVTLSQISQPQVDGSEAEQERKLAAAKARVEQFKTTREQLAADRQLQQQLEQMQHEAEAVKEQLARTTEAVSKLESERAETLRAQSASSDQAAKLQAEADRLHKLIEEAAKQQAELQRKLADLRKELAEREQPQQAEVKIQPSGSGLNFNPYFVECAANSIVLLDRPQPLRITRGEIGSHPELRKLMDTVKQDGKGTLMFLVRPDGVATYNATRNFVRSNYVKNGKLAVAGQGQIDLSLFKK